MELPKRVVRGNLARLKTNVSPHWFSNNVPPQLLLVVVQGRIDDGIVVPTQPGDPSCLCRSTPIDVFIILHLWQVRQRRHNFPTHTAMSAMLTRAVATTVLVPVEDEDLTAWLGTLIKKYLTFDTM